MIVTKTLTLTGAHEGKTISLNGTSFVDGSYTFSADQKSAESFCNYFKKSYQAVVTDEDGNSEGGIPEQAEGSDNGAVSIPEDESDGITLDVEGETETDEFDSSEDTDNGLFTD